MDVNLRVNISALFTLDEHRRITRRVMFTMSCILLVSVLFSRLIVSLLFTLVYKDGFETVGCPKTIGAYWAYPQTVIIPQRIIFLFYFTSKPDPYLPHAT